MPKKPKGGGKGVQRTAPKYPKPPKPKTPKSRVQAGPEAGSPWLVQFMGQNKENMPVMRLYNPPPKKKSFEPLNIAKICSGCETSRHILQSDLLSHLSLFWLVRRPAEDFGFSLSFSCDSTLCKTSELSSTSGIPLKSFSVTRYS